MSTINYCAFNVALPVATLSAILANPAAAQPAFFEAFNGCMNAKSSTWTGMSLYTNTACKWH